MCKVNSSLNYIQKTTSASQRKSAANAHWIPNADVYVTEGKLVVKVELAGMRREDLEVAVEGTRLIISGQRPDGCRGPKCKFLVMEIDYGSFECAVDIPPGYDLAQAQAAYTNGFLRVDVPPLKASPSLQRIAVDVTDSK